MGKTGYFVDASFRPAYSSLECVPILGNRVEVRIRQGKTIESRSAKEWHNKKERREDVEHERESVTPRKKQSELVWTTMPRDAFGRAGWVADGISATRAEQGRQPKGKRRWLSNANVASSSRYFGPSQRRRQQQWQHRQPVAQESIA